MNRRFIILEGGLADAFPDSRRDAIERRKGKNSFLTRFRRKKKRKKKEKKTERKESIESEGRIR